MNSKEIKQKIGEINDQVYESIIQNPMMIGEIEQTPDLCMLALIKDYTCFDLIKVPTNAMKMFVKDRLELIEELGCDVIIT